MENSDFRQQRFSVRSQNGEEWIRLLSTLFHHEQTFRCLEIGCGTGETLRQLSGFFTNASFVGLDLSRASIEAASNATQHEPSRVKLNFVTADYFAYHDGEFDLILSDSTFHLMSVSTDELFAKVARDLRPGGLLGVSMPKKSIFNFVLVSLRRLLKCFRSPVLDRIIFRVGRLLHPSVPSETLWERVSYMYVIPHRYVSRALSEILAAQFGLTLVSQSSVRLASLAQPLHARVIYRKQL